MGMILPIGGRVKSASAGLDHLFSHEMSVDDAITKLRREPPEWLKRAFFPRVGKELAQAIRGIGFFRPSLKTDQGMAGNFLPFRIDPSLRRSNLGDRIIGYEEGCAIPELWSQEASLRSEELQGAFHELDLRSTYAILKTLGSRSADKGRLPFFLIRPALTTEPIVFGMDVLEKVQGAVDTMLAACIERAEKLERDATGATRPLRALYVQPDVFVQKDGTVAVERLNCPDVCFFLASIEDTRSRVLPHVRDIVIPMREHAVEKILSAMGREVTLVTRDEVIAEQQDVLELLEIKELETALRSKGAVVSVIPVSMVSTLQKGTRVLLLNLDYASASTAALMRLHAAAEIECFPNPYFQMACHDASGLSQSVLSPEDKYFQRFLSWTRSEPSGESGRLDVLRQIDGALNRNGIESRVLHVVLETETVPVLRDSMHAWRQLEARATRPANVGGGMRFRDIPANPEKLILRGDTGPRLHGFRFMYLF